jgi:hypothetical protein
MSNHELHADTLLDSTPDIHPTERRDEKYARIAYDRFLKESYYYCVTTHHALHERRRRPCRRDCGATCPRGPRRSRRRVQQGHLGSIATSAAAMAVFIDEIDAGL